MKFRFKSKTAGLAGLMAAAAMLVMAVGASAASAYDFHASVVGGELVSKATTNQVFTISSSTSVTCTTAAGKGTALKASEPTQVMTVEYASCEFKDGILKGSATVTPAEYEFMIGTKVNSGNPNLLEGGTVKILKTITITASFCKVEVPAAGNESLSSVSYENVGSSPSRKLEEISNVSGITYKGNCGSGSNATYSGNNLVEEVGGEVWWE